MFFILRVFACLTGVTDFYSLLSCVQYQVKCNDIQSQASKVSPHHRPLCVEELSSTLDHKEKRLQQKHCNCIYRSTMDLWIMEWRDENFRISLTWLFACSTPPLKAALLSLSAQLSMCPAPFKTYSLRKREEKKNGMLFTFVLNRNLTSQRNKEQWLATASFWVKSAFWDGLRRASGSWCEQYHVVFINIQIKHYWSVLGTLVCL